MRTVIGPHAGRLTVGGFGGLAALGSLVDSRPLSKSTMTNIYVGNLAYSVTSDDLRTVFSEYGEVSSCNVIMDKYSGRSKGFGFVEMPDSGAAAAAIEALNEQDLQGRNMRVNEARPREDRREGRARH